MDAKKITEDYHDWHNIAELRLLGLSRSQMEKPLNFDPFGHAELSLFAKI